MRTPGFPVELRLEGRRALVVGADPVTGEKVRRLLDSGASVVLVAPTRAEGVPAGVDWRPRAFKEPDLDGVDLALLTDRDAPALAAQLRAACDRRRVLLWTHDALATCDFTMAALVEAGPVRVSVSTGARDPLLASTLRRALAAAMGPDFVRWARDVAARWKQEPIAAHRARLRGLEVSLRVPEVKTNKKNQEDKKR